MAISTSKVTREHLDVIHSTTSDHPRICVRDRKRRRGFTRFAITIMAVLLSSPPSPPARAEGTHHGAFVSTRANRGTHFIAEIAGGLATLQGPGPALEALVGVGGRPRWSPLRVYLFGEFAYTTGSTSLNTATAGRVEQTHENRDFGAGLRAYVPLGPVRLFADALGGTTNLAVSQHDERRGYTVERQRWLPYYGVAAGLQLRLMRQVSVGVRAKAVFTDSNVLAELTGISEKPSSVRLTTTGGITFHF